MQRKFGQALTALKERSFVGYKKIATTGGFCDLDQILIKATAPNELPLPEKYVQQILKIFSVCPCSPRAFSLNFTRRFGRTRCWRVALKCLILLHRLLRSGSGNWIQSELCWSRSNSLLSLDPCYFRGASSSSGSEYFTGFIQSYACLLDESLDCFFENNRKPSSELENLPEKMQEIGRIVDFLPQLQSLIDRVMDCEPAGAAAKSFVIRSAMKLIVRDSFLCYAVFRRDIVLLLDNLFQLQYRFCVEAFRIYKKAASQGGRLAAFYEKCKDMWVCGSYEYPVVDRIPAIHVHALESFLDGMWELTEEEASSSSPSTFSSTEGEEDKENEGRLSDMALFPIASLKTVVTTEWEKFEEEEERQPLVDLGENGGSCDWEVLLEFSVAAWPWTHWNFLNVPVGFQFPAPEVGDAGRSCTVEEKNEQMAVQLYDPNPFFCT